MANDTLRTLFHPFEAGALPVPSKGERVLFLGAEPGFRLPEGFSAESLTCVQGFRPDLLALKASGFTVIPQAEGTDYDMALVLCSRHRGQNEMRIAEAIERVVSDGMIVVAGGNVDGIDSLRRRIGTSEDRLADEIAGRPSGGVIIERSGGDKEVSFKERRYHPSSPKVPLGGHLSKYHGVVFWFQPTREAEVFARSIKEWQSGWPLIDRRFRTAPGMFSFDRVDTGSKFLAEHLPSDLSGVVADFCAGWGFLAAEAAARSPAISALDLYEADFASLEAARLNVGGAKPETQFFWRDLLSEPVERRYDAIVMNPPFHRSNKAEPELGQAMVRAAAGALKRGGRLLMVANRQLPYEQMLDALFTRHRQLFVDGIYKVFCAWR